MESSEYYVSYSLCDTGFLLHRGVQSISKRKALADEVVFNKVKCAIRKDVGCDGQVAGILSAANKRCMSEAMFGNMALSGGEDGRFYGRIFGFLWSFGRLV